MLHQDKDGPDRLARAYRRSFVGGAGGFQFGGLRRSDPLQRILLEHESVYRGLGRRVPAVLSWYPAQRLSSMTGDFVTISPCLPSGG